ncbi:hypothetical protein N2382_06260 [SAR92 clade bacterium H921]|nr:hypothetical protein [SAR92 clade bacterium H921]
MLSKEELVSQILSGTISAWKDEEGIFWISGHGGQGVPMFTRLKPDHPFNMIIEELLLNEDLTQGEYQFEYYAQRTLSRLSTPPDQ